MLSVTHTSDVVRERTLLLYSIVTGMIIGVGNVLSLTIWFCMNDLHKEFYLPSLITKLCKTSRVVWDATDKV